MKKSLLFWGAATIAALSFISCNRTEIENPAESSLTHTIKINASYDIATKTSIVEGENSASFIWSSDDASRFTVTENDIKGTGIELALSNGNKSAMISATFATKEDSKYVYSAFLAANKTSNGSPKIPAAQNSTSDSFDPDADILIAKPLTFAEPQDELSMQFARPVVINKMTLKGLTAGEVISTVEISGDKELVGYYTIDSQAWKGQDNTVTVTVNQTVPESGEVVVYFITMPVEGVTLTVSVTTPEYTYSKTFAKTIDFKENNVTVFGVNNLTKEEKEDYSGTYVLTNDGGTYFANTYVSGNNVAACQMTKEGSNYYYDPDLATLSKAQMTLSLVSSGEYAGMYTIVQDEKYLYAAGSKDKENHLKTLSLAEDESLPASAYWEVSCDEDVWSVVASKASFSKVLQYNTSKFFSCYASATQTGVALIPVENFKPTPVITLDSESISIEASSVSNIDAGVSFNSNATEVEVLAYDDELLTVASEWLTVAYKDGAVTYSATENTSDTDRTAYIEILAANADERVVAKYITVTQLAAGSTKVIDVLNLLFTGVTGTNYTDWTGKKSESNAEYAGNSAGGNSSIQLRSSNNNSGVVTTSSGGKVTKVTVTWNSNTTNGRTLNIYGSDTAYSAASDLYDTTKQGTLLGTIVYGTSTELEISGDYAYLGFRSASGAMYLTEVKITWDN